MSVKHGAHVAFTTGSVGIHQLPLGSVDIVKTHSVQTVTVNATSTDLRGHFVFLNNGEESMNIDVYSTAAEFEQLLESMLTITDVAVTMEDHTLRSSDRLENYGRTWSITFMDHHHHSLMVSNGADVGVVANGGTLLGSSTSVYVERVHSGSVSTSAVVTTLSAGTSYIARVKAFNGVFWSAYSTSAISVAPRVVAPESPTGVYMSAQSDADILVWWTAPIENGGAAITGFNVQWATDMVFGISSSSKFVPYDSGKGGSFVINGLSGASSFYVRVAAKNAQGYSTYTLAKPKIDWAPVWIIEVKTAHQGTAFYIKINDGARTQQTANLVAANTPLSGVQMQQALQDLSNVRSVLVSRWDMGSACVIRYAVTFVDVGFVMSGDKRDEVVVSQVDCTNDKVLPLHGFTVDGATLTTTIEDLIPGQEYFARIKVCRDIIRTRALLARPDALLNSITTFPIKCVSTIYTNVALTGGSGSGSSEITPEELLLLGCTGNDDSSDDDGSDDDAEDMSEASEEEVDEEDLEEYNEEIAEELVIPDTFKSFQSEFKELLDTFGCC